MAPLVAAAQPGHLAPPLPYSPHIQQSLYVQPPASADPAASTAGATASPVIAASGENGSSGTKKGVKRPASGTVASAQPPKEKKTRSKAACGACKSVKQKCEGPPYIPCRRCQLYKLDCQFPPGTKTVPRPSEYGPIAASAPGEASAVVSNKLSEIAARLRSIESALRVQRTSSPTPRSNSSYSHNHRSPSARSSEAGHAEVEDVDDNTSAGKAAADTANPLYEINATLAALGNQGNTKPVNLLDVQDYGAPDVLRRGVLTPDECQQLFDFFFASLHPWMMMLSLDEDREAMAVRQKSPLLFHTILMVSTAYSSPFPSQLHLTLITFLNNIIAPQLLSPQPHELNTDFLRALDLINLYKPVQFGARRAENCDDAEAMRMSKVNGLASWMLQGIFSRTSERLELSSVVGKFSRAYSASASGTPIPKSLIRDLRLYFWLLSNDVHGNVQSGRRCNMDGAQALTTTRLFSSLQLQPYDVRLAASVEMYEVARPILRSYHYERTRRIPRPDLERFNQGMKTFDETWIPALLRQLAIDPLAMTVLCPFAAFIVLEFNATAFVSWKATRLYVSSDTSPGAGGSGNDGRPGTGSDEGKNKRLRTEGARGLTDWEFESLIRCIQAAEMLVFSLCEESRVPGAWRKVQWAEAERQDGFRKLVLDDQMVEQTRWGMDAVTCIAYIFPLVFLSKLVNEGILTANLTLLRNATSQPAWLPTQKLPRLLELGAVFLDAIATNPHHPSRAQAQVVRTLLATGVKGTRLSPPVAETISPSGPSHAATVISPTVPTLQSLPYIPPQPGYPDGPPPPHLWAGAPPGQNYSFPPPTGATPPSGSVPPPVLVPGMDEALGNVLNDFEPFFGDSSGGLWEWGGFGGGVGGGAAMPGTPGSGVGVGGLDTGLNAEDWAGGTES
ncbi:hypothetical protein JCM11641_000804 [Rhodosporidiobolus odoratus]